MILVKFLVLHVASEAMGTDMTVQIQRPRKETLREKPGARKKKL